MPDMPAGQTVRCRRQSGEAGTDGSGRGRGKNRVQGALDVPTQGGVGWHGVEHGLTEAAYRGDLDLAKDQKGNNDLLCLTRPDIVEGIHAVLIDFNARWVSGEPMAGDDAAEAMFVKLEDVKRYVTRGETLRVIALSAQQMGVSPA